MHWYSGIPACLALAAASLPAFAADLHVPGEYATIQEAVDAAGYNDDIIVAEGTYFLDGSIDLGFMSLSITGTAVDGVPVTILDAQSSSRHFLIDMGSANQVISNLHFINGHSGTGGAIRVLEPNGITFDNCVFETCNATSSGGAVYSKGSDETDSIVTFLGCTFLGNTAPSGGAVYSKTANLDDAGHADVTFENCEFLGNVASGSGGAVYLYREVKGLFKDSTLIGNEATDNGGAIATSQHADVKTLRCIITDTPPATWAAAST